MNTRSLRDCRPCWYRARALACNTPLFLLRFRLLLPGRLCQRCRRCQRGAPDATHFLSRLGGCTGAAVCRGCSRERCEELLAERIGRWPLFIGGVALNKVDGSITRCEAQLTRPQLVLSALMVRVPSVRRAQHPTEVWALR